MTPVSKTAYFDVLDDIVNKYNNTVHRTIKMKRIYVTSDSYAEYNEDSNEKDPKFKVGDRARISKFKIHFRGLMLLVISLVNPLLELCMKKNCNNLFKKNFE